MYESRMVMLQIPQVELGFHPHTRNRPEAQDVSRLFSRQRLEFPLASSLRCLEDVHFIGPVWPSEVCFTPGEGTSFRFRYRLP